MIDFMSHYKFILCIINNLYKLKYHTVNLACKVVLSACRLIVLATKMSSLRSRRFPFHAGRGEETPAQMAMKKCFCPLRVIGIMQLAT